MAHAIETVLVTGGAGYVGSALVPKLLEEGHLVRVLDLFLYGEHVLNSVKDHPRLGQIKGDIRDRALLERSVEGVDAVIHLACISNDPSFELDPKLGKSINYDAFIDLVDVSRNAGIKRFIYASSSSVYGIKNEANVTEDLPRDPLTDYSRYKALCEDVLLEAGTPGYCTLIIRPATVCGYSPRLRLDLTVNILTNHAVNRGKITVFGGEQMRPNIHIDDMTDLYVQCLKWPDEAVDGKIYNVGYENQEVNKIAQIVRRVVGSSVEVDIVPTNDTRSYHISSEKIRQDLGFAPRHTIEEAVNDLVDAFHAGKVPAPMDSIGYYNLKLMQAIDLQ